MKIENLTIVFIDIKDFTAQTSGQSREANERLLVRFATLVKPMAKAFGGRVVKSMGDAFLLAFYSPTDSLHCAMAIHDHLVGINARLPPEERFELRAAVNVGEVRVEGGDVFGEAVNIASRIETLANGGEIYFSEAVYLVMNKSEVPIVEVGLRELKGIPEPVKIYRVPKDNENGGYHLTGSGQTPPAGLISNPLPTPTLPYGGFALERVKDRLPKPETEGSRSQYFSPAFTRLHFQAFVRKDRWSRAGGIRRLLAHPVYAFHWLGGALAILFNSRTLASPGLFWAGIKDRFKKRLGFRLAVLALIVAIGLAVVGWLTWRDYEMKLAAEREAAAQRVAAAEQEAATLRQQVAEREAAARNTRARQKPVEKKRKPGFHWFWDK